MGKLDGRVAIVTGGAKGIGRHYCEGLAHEGATVVVVDVVDGVAVAEEIDAKTAAGRAFALRCDVSDEAAVKSLVSDVVGRAGRIDILVNNAAIFSTLKPGEPTDIDVALWDRVMAVNVRGPFLMVKHVSPHMIARKSGKVINIASGGAYKGLPHMLHYVTSKGAMLGFTRALSRDLGKHGICVNTLAPGLIMSDTIATNTEHLDETRAPVIASRAIKRDGYPRDLIGALVFLASSDSDFMTGQTLAVDGGSINT